MTYYSGGKKRIGHDVSLEIKSMIDAIGEGQSFVGYCEPFCGMLGVYHRVLPMLGPGYRFVAGDRNRFVIKLWKGLVGGWRPPRSCTRARFYKLKERGGDSLETIFLGHAAALRACYLTTFRDDNPGRVARQADTCTEIAKTVKDVDFRVGSYEQFSDLEGFIIYCDPPYRGTKHHYFEGPVNRSKFDHDAFDEWCRSMSKKNLVIVSEFSQPPESVKIWQKGKECLFAY